MGDLSSGAWPPGSRSMESDDVSYGTDGVGFGRDGHESVGSDLYAHNATTISHIA